MDFLFTSCASATTDGREARMLLLWADARDEVPARMASVVVVDVDVEADMMSKL